eukprot:SAG22_NODE_852_length_6847_cov_14.600830_2_plen_182_part_00
MSFCCSKPAAKDPEREQRADAEHAWAGAQPDDALWAAARDGQIVQMGLLLAGGHNRHSGGANWRNPQAANGTPMIAACEHCQLAAIDLLLRGTGGAVDVNIQCDAGRTALHVAARHVHAPVVAKLLATGRCREQLKDKAGFTALALAKHSQHLASGGPECVLLLEGKKLPPRGEVSDKPPT